jgi:hypothetical protein
VLDGQCRALKAHAGGACGATQYIQEGINYGIKTAAGVHASIEV